MSAVIARRAGKAVRENSALRIFAKGLTDKGLWRVVVALQGLERDTLDVMSPQGRSGSLHLAAVPTFATRWLIPRLPLLAAQHPEHSAHIETSTRPFMFADTAFDAALYAGTVDQVRRWAGTRAMRLLAEVLPSKSN